MGICLSQDGLGTSVSGLGSPLREVASLGQLTTSTSRSILGLPSGWALSQCMRSVTLMSPWLQWLGGSAVRAPFNSITYSTLLFLYPYAVLTAITTSVARLVPRWPIITHVSFVVHCLISSNLLSYWLPLQLLLPAMFFLHKKLMHNRDRQGGRACFMGYSLES